MTTALAVPAFHSTTAAPDVRRRLVRALAEHVEDFSPADVHRAVATWTPGLTAATRELAWDDLVLDINLPRRPRHPTADGMNAVETLREAARLIRERAEAATPGPWAAGKGYGATVSLGVTDHAAKTSHHISGAEDVEAYGGYLIGESMNRADIAHVASWHPTVAFAVADWLDDAAEHQVVHEQIVAEYVQGTGQVPPPDQPRILVSPLAVARAYLGEA